MAKYRRTGEGSFEVWEQIPDPSGGGGCLGIIVLFFVLCAIGKGCESSAKGADAPPTTRNVSSLITESEPTPAIEVDRIIVSTGCALAVLSYCGLRGIPACVLAGVLAWVYTEIALVLTMAGLVALLWKFSNHAACSPHSKSQPVKNEEIIDCEYTVVGKE